VALWSDSCGARRLRSCRLPRAPSSRAGSHHWTHVSPIQDASSTTEQRSHMPGMAVRGEIHYFVGRHRELPAHSTIHTDTYMRTYTKVQNKTKQSKENSTTQKEWHGTAKLNKAKLHIANPYLTQSRWRYTVSQISVARPKYHNTIDQQQRKIGVCVLCVRVCV